MWSIMSLSISITWERVKNAGSWAPPQTCGIRICVVIRPLGDFYIRGSLRHTETAKQVEEGGLLVKQRPKMVDKARLVCGEFLQRVCP